MVSTGSRQQNKAPNRIIFPMCGSTGSRARCTPRGVSSSCLSRAFCQGRAQRKEHTRHVKWGDFLGRATGTQTPPTNTQTRCFYLWLQLIYVSITRARSQQNQRAMSPSFPSTQGNNGTSSTCLVRLQPLTDPLQQAAGVQRRELNPHPQGTKVQGHLSVCLESFSKSLRSTLQSPQAPRMVWGAPLCTEGPSRLCTKGKGLQCPELSSHTCLVTPPAPRLWTDAAALYQLHEVIYGQHHSITRRGVHQFAQKIGNSTKPQDLKEKTQQKPTATGETALSKIG